ncbi:hypothetical protein BHM03_00050248 [Ensete ventricosum]|nr:hypothetical protein BHM03_00050248 [Ensete ventricosum]
MDFLILSRTPFCCCPIASNRPSSSLPCPPPQLLPPTISSAGHHLPFSFSVTSTTTSLALSRNHRWAHLTLTLLPPPSPVLGHRSPASRHHKPLLNCCRSRVMPSCRNSRLPLPSLIVGYCLLPPAPIVDTPTASLLQQPPAPAILNRRLQSSSSRAFCYKSSIVVLFLCQLHHCLPQPLPDGPTASALLLRSLSPPTTYYCHRYLFGRCHIPLPPLPSCCCSHSPRCCPTLPNCAFLYCLLPSLSAPSSLSSLASSRRCRCLLLPSVAVVLLPQLPLPITPTLLSFFPCPTPPS